MTRHPPLVESPDEPAARRSGMVTYHNLGRGFGKIHAHDSGQTLEYFFHATACHGSFAKMIEGVLVTFTWRITEKGPRAFDVQRDRHAQAAVVEAIDARGNR